MAKNKERKYTALYDARRKKDLTQEELADLFNVTTVTIRNWETNKAKPSVDNIIRLSALLDVSLDDIMNDYKNKEEA